MVPDVLSRHGFKNVREQKSRGVLPGARLLADVAGKRNVAISVKASTKRNVSFTKLAKNGWRTLSAVDFVVVVVPGEDPEKIEILAFDAEHLVTSFDRVWAELKKAGRSLSDDIPIFIPLDKTSRKNLGHDIVNLKASAMWSARVSASEVRAKKVQSNDEFFNQLKQQIADHLGVDVSKIEFDLRIKTGA